MSTPVARVYLDESGVRTLVDAGMGVGPHSHSHEVASRLPVERQRNEIALSCTVIESIGGSRMWGYCHPHGSPDAFLEQTEKLSPKQGAPSRSLCGLSTLCHPLPIPAAMRCQDIIAMPFRMVRHHLEALELNEPDIRLLTGMRQWGVIATGQHLVDDLSAMVQTPEWGPLRY